MIRLWSEQAADPTSNKYKDGYSRLDTTLSLLIRIYTNWETNTNALFFSPTNKNSIFFCLQSEYGGVWSVLQHIRPSQRRHSSQRGGNVQPAVPRARRTQGLWALSFNSNSRFRDRDLKRDEVGYKGQVVCSLRLCHSCVLEAGGTLVVGHHVEGVVWSRDSDVWRLYTSFSPPDIVNDVKFKEFMHVSVLCIFHVALLHHGAHCSWTVVFWLQCFLILHIPIALFYLVLLPGEFQLVRIPCKRDVSGEWGAVLLQDRVSRRQVLHKTVALSGRASFSAQSSHELSAGW